MESSEIWKTILIPLLIGPLCVYFKTLYDNYVYSNREHELIKYNNKKDYLTTVLNTFYWPLYLKLLSIEQLNYNIPIKNKFEYISDDSDLDIDDNLDSNGCSKMIPLYVSCEQCNFKKNKSDNSENITININSLDRDIVLDTDTIHLLEDHINILFSEALIILETHIYVVRLNNKLNKNIIQFIKYCKIRSIILEGSIHKKYNIEYFGVKDNTSKLLHLIELDLLNYQKEYNSLIKKGPY